MLLLILFAGCLASCAAQTASDPRTTTSLPISLPQQIKTTPVLLTPDSTGNVVAILQTAVQSRLEQNETTIGPVLTELASIIKLLNPELNFSLTLKNITKV